MHTLGNLADLVGGAVEGDRSLPIRGMAPLDTAAGEDLSFLTHPRHKHQLTDTRAGAVLAAPGTPVPASCALVAVEDPFAAHATLMRLFYEEPAVKPGVHPSAWVDPGARIHETASVGPGAAVLVGARVDAGAEVGPAAVVGEGVRVGEGTRIAAGAVVIEGTELGARCRIGPGAVIGGAGFGYEPTPDGWLAIPQVGRVVFEDEVEVGANTAVDRATLGETRIESGCKFDNLVQIGHNVKVGRGTVIVAQVGVAGSTRIGKQVQIGGQAGLMGHLEIGDGARIGARAAVQRRVPAGETWSGAPAFEHARWRRSVKALPQLPDLLKRVRQLEAEIAELKKKQRD